MGNAAIDLDLAGLATGPVDRVWYSPAGDQLRIRTSSGKVFETNDFDRWAAAPGRHRGSARSGGPVDRLAGKWRAGSQSGKPKSAGVCFRTFRVPLRRQRQELGQSDGVPRAVHSSGITFAIWPFPRPMKTKSWWPDRPESSARSTAASPGAVSMKAFRIFPRPASAAFPKVPRAPRSNCPAPWSWNGSRENGKPGGPRTTPKRPVNWCIASC